MKNQRIKHVFKKKGSKLNHNFVSGIPVNVKYKAKSKISRKQYYIIIIIGITYKKQVKRYSSTVGDLLSSFTVEGAMEDMLGFRKV